MLKQYMDAAGGGASAAGGSASQGAGAEQQMAALLQLQQMISSTQQRQPQVDPRMQSSFASQHGPPTGLLRRSPSSASLSPPASGSQSPGFSTSPVPHNVHPPHPPRSPISNLDGPLRRTASASQLHRSYIPPPSTGGPAPSGGPIRVASPSPGQTGNVNMGGPARAQFVSMGRSGFQPQQMPPPNQAPHQQPGYLQQGQGGWVNADGYRRR
ncbi:hypothetical protein BJ742DRAFT_793683 [Cladochytrium replicatum]|nr:hypothetical protein BJ742DRAFT_793683 [Cladochytrium replicatum]